MLPVGDCLAQVHERGICLVIRPAAHVMVERGCEEEVFLGGGLRLLGECSRHVADLLAGLLPVTHGGQVVAHKLLYERPRLGELVLGRHGRSSYCKTSHQNHTYSFHHRVSAVLDHILHANFVWSKFGGEVHLKRPRELSGSAEGEVDVLAEHLGDIGARDLHPLGKVGLGDTEFLHAEKNLAQEYRADMVDGGHRGQGSVRRGQCAEPPNLALKTSSRRVKYAAEYFTFGLCAELLQDRFMMSQSFEWVF